MKGGLFGTYIDLTEFKVGCNCCFTTAVQLQVSCPKLMASHG